MKHLAALKKTRCSWTPCLHHCDAELNNCQEHYTVTAAKTPGPAGRLFLFQNHFNSLK